MIITLYPDPNYTERYKKRYDASRYSTRGTYEGADFDSANEPTPIQMSAEGFLERLRFEQLMGIGSVLSKAYPKMEISNSSGEVIFTGEFKSGWWDISRAIDPDNQYMYLHWEGFVDEPGTFLGLSWLVANSQGVKR